MRQEKKNYIDEIVRFSEKLGKASHWHDSGKTVGYIERANKNCYVYEFYCYMRIIADLMNGYDVVYVPGKGADPHKFPQAAAEKNHVPRFDLLDKKTGKVLYQVCTGTRIGTKYPGQNIHPDISFQTGNASDNPTWKDLLMIMDAKFKKNPGHKLPMDEVTSFCELVNNIFELNTSPIPKIKFNELRDIVGHALLTNGLAHNDDSKYVKSRKIKEVEFFDVGKRHNVKG